MPVGLYNEQVSFGAGVAELADAQDVGANSGALKTKYLLENKTS